jgi:hypothetical protein
VLDSTPTTDMYVLVLHLYSIVADAEHSHREMSGLFLLVLLPVVYRPDYSGLQKELSLWATLHRLSVVNI